MLYFGPISSYISRKIFRKSVGLTQNQQSRVFDEKKNINYFFFVFLDILAFHQKSSIGDDSPKKLYLEPLQLV